MVRLLHGLITYAGSTALSKSFKATAIARSFWTCHSSACHTYIIANAAHVHLPFASTTPNAHSPPIMYTVVLFVTRDSSLTLEEFQDYYEHKHIPLAYSLTQDVWPTTFHRRYFARISRKGFGGPANPDRPPLTLRGDMKGLDCDCIAEMTFPSENAFQKFYKRIY
tara:strand:- start:21304 stop:21801 length:498 start_codon:yes stop_codon:yes gene_type:complete